MRISSSVLAAALVLAATSSGAQSATALRTALIPRTDTTPDAAQTRIETRRHPWAGLGIGLVGGAITGAVIGYASGDDHCTPKNTNPNGFGLDECFMTYNRNEKAALGAGILGAIGGVSGLIIGSLHKTEVVTAVADRAGLTPIVDAKRVGFSFAY